MRGKAGTGLFLRRLPAFLAPIRRLFELLQRLIEPYAKKGQVVAENRKEVLLWV
jgi:hypothetical protein